MAYYPKKPRVTELEVMKQIEQRTGIPIEGIKKILDAYDDIVKEALLMNIEVPFGTVGYFSWKQINARENVSTWNAFDKVFTEPHDVPGFQKTVMRINKKWAEELKQATRFEVGESNPMRYDDIEDEE